MPRAIWSGAISFGLVNVPVKLYSATSQKTVRFHQLSSKTGARIRQKRVDPSTDEEVPYEEIVKADPKDASSYLDMSRIYLEMRNFAMARQMEDKAKSVQPDNIEVRIVKAVIFQGASLQSRGVLLAIWGQGRAYSAVQAGNYRQMPRAIVAKTPTRASRGSTSERARMRPQAPQPLSSCP